MNRDIAYSGRGSARFRSLSQGLLFGFCLFGATTARAQTSGVVSATPSAPSRAQTSGVVSATPSQVTASEATAPNAAVQKLAPLEAVAAAAKHNPELAAALADLRSIKSVVEGEEHRYATVWGIEAGVTRTKNPSLGPSGTMIPQTDEVAVSTDLRRRFSTGGNVGLTVAGKRFSTRTYFGLPPVPFKFGPAYGASVKLDATQPLLRGCENDICEANLRQARIQAEQSAATYHRITSDGLAAVLRAYWESAYAESALEIQREALRLAVQQRDEAKARIDTGALAPTELNSFDTRVAQLESDNSDAETELERRLIELERLSAVDAHSVSLDAPPEQASTEVLSLAELRQAARSRSPSLKELVAAVKLAESRAAIAGDALRPALDVNAYVQAQGLGNREVTPALEQVGELSALSAHVGLRYEMSVDSTQRRMQSAQARYDVAAAKKRVEAAERQLDANLQKSYTESRASRRRVELAARSVEFAERQHQSERALFETGSSTSIRVREAEEQVRSSRLRLLRARVDAVATEIEIDRITGRLGDAYLDQIAQAQ
ncbi:MAG: TolC family protein [Myxococcales bacterium]